MTEVVGGGPIQQNFIGCKTKKMSLASMKKMDLLSLFFFDPLHQTFEYDIDSPQTMETKEDINTAEQTTEEISEISDPADLSSNESLNDELFDTSSNTTDCEPLWCGCSTSCFCEEEWWASYSSEEPRNWEEDDDREMLTMREINQFKYADDWERDQRKKTQRGYSNLLRAKRSEKKDKVWEHSFVKAIIQKKQEIKQSIIADQLGRQRQNSSTSVPCYSRFGTQPSYRHNDESAEVQRAIALSLSSSSPSSSSRRNNVLDCGLTQRQLNDLMNRELTPEDYELLLSLDEGVAKKTVEKSALDSFASRSATPHDVEDSALGETLTILPCGHFFHENCVREWLSKSSVNCPIDGLPVHSH